MIIVMLSHPTPPVSLLGARQLSIMFSLILDRGCLAAIPRRTNSTTACDDWQSQIPWNCQHRSLRELSRDNTVASYNKKFIIVRDSMCHNVRKGSDDLLLRREIGALLEFEVANGPRKCKVTVDSAKVDETASRADSSLLACIGS